ncbi:Pex [Neofusicoccum parvum]|uniref:Pex n=2 Tax=Neofusicoccum parvum TaxID=310453 RepID=A0ACB5RN94_9PEZI|nr:putative integral membrane protein [Neofusicoccum parvum UCRNP2]GME21975.1 Pex [Neofusicoccum parvum]GME34217.1 Pex [Neofusicoccum parvum]
MNTAKIDFIEAKYGMGKHAETLSLDDRVSQTAWFWASIWIYLLGLGLSKMSILLQYSRIFVGKRTLLAIRLTFVFIVLWTTQAVIVSILQCVPVDSFWNRLRGGSTPKCISAKATYYANASLNILTDFIVIGLPLPVLNQLHVSSGQRLGLFFAFSIGGAGCIISLVRLHTVTEAIKNKDPILANPEPALWSAIEVAVCIICACLPSLRPLLVRILMLVGIKSTHDATSHPSVNGRSRPPGRSWGNSAGVDRLGSGKDFVTVDELELQDSKDQRIKIETTLEVVSTMDSSGQSRKSEGGESNDALVPDGRWYQAQVTNGR